MNLKDATDNIPKFSLAGQEYDAKCVSVYDGDTCHVVFNYNGQLTKWSLRLKGINCAEIKSKDPKAIAARDFLRSLILDKIVKIKIDGFDKYGRLVGLIISDNININKLMIDEGHAISFMHEYNEL